MSRLRTTIEEDTDLAKQSEGTRLGVGSRKSFIESYKYEEMRHLDERRLFPMPKPGEIPLKQQTLVAANQPRPALSKSEVVSTNRGC